MDEEETPRPKITKLADAPVDSSIKIRTDYVPKGPRTRTISPANSLTVS